MTYYFLYDYIFKAILIQSENLSFKVFCEDSVRSFIKCLPKNNKSDLKNVVRNVLIFNSNSNMYAIKFKEKCS